MLFLSGNEYNHEMSHKRRKHHQHIKKNEENIDYAHDYEQDNEINNEMNDDEGDGFDDGIYSDKYQLTAFLLSLFLGQFGAGRFYIGDVTVGSVKLFLPLMVCLFSCGIARVIAEATGVGVTRGGMRTSEGRENLTRDGGICGWIAVILTSCLYPVGICAWWIWWLVDWILFAMNRIPDKYGRTLIPM